MRKIVEIYEKYTGILLENVYIYFNFCEIYFKKVNSGYEKECFGEKRKKRKKIKKNTS